MTGPIRVALALAGSVVVTLTGSGQVLDHLDHKVPPLQRFSPVDCRSIDEGRAMVDTVREPGVDLAIAGVARTTADSERLFAWFREVEQLQRGAYVPVLQRFSATPRIEDLAELVLEEAELEDLRTCRPGDCEIKLAAAEITRIKIAIGAAGVRWQEAAQVAFRQAMLARATAFLRDGFAGLPPYEDHRKPVVVSEDFDRLLSGCSLAGLQREAITDYLRRYPVRNGTPVETLLLWSRDVLGDAKPIVGITALSLFPASPAGDPPVVAATQVYASHYITASLSLTAIVQTPNAATRYLVYGRCTMADVFGGAFGGFIRRNVQKRIRKEGPPALDSLRRKLEAGPPARPAHTTMRDRHR